MAAAGKRLKRENSLSWWQEPENADAAYFENSALFLEDDSKRKVESLFGVLDANEDFVLSVEDFTHKNEMARVAVHKWEELRAEFTVDENITPLQFIRGIKRLAMKQPVDATRFTGPAMETHLKCFLRLNDSANTAVRNLCDMLLDSMVIYDDATKAHLERAWSVCDVDGDGTITISDFGGSIDQAGRVVFRNHAYIDFCTKLWAHLDLNHDGTITRQEFVEGIKRGVISGLSLSDGTFHSDLHLPQVITTVNANMAAWCAEATNVVLQVRATPDSFRQDD